MLVSLYVALLLLDAFHVVTFGLPLGFDGGAFVVEFGQLLPYLLHLFGVVLALDGLAFDLQLADGTLDILKFLRHRVDLQPQTRGGLVDQVDGLVGKETVGDVTHRQLHGRDDGLVQDTDVVVRLVTLLQATEDADGRSLVRLVDHDLLETTLQCLVLLEILLVFLQSGGTDGTQLATRQGRLQDVGRVHGAFAAACAYQGVDLIDEQDDFAIAVDDFLDDILQTFLKLALVFCAGEQGAHVQAEHGLCLQVLRHVAVDDTLGQTLHDGGLTHARLTYQDRVVLCASAQDLQHTTDLLVTADDRVELALLGEFVQVLGETVQAVVVLLGVLRVDLLALAELLDGGFEVVLTDALVLHHL